MTIKIIEVAEAQSHLSMAIDYLQRVIDMLDGSGKDTDIEIDLAEAEANTSLAHALLKKIQPSLFTP